MNVLISYLCLSIDLATRAPTRVSLTDSEDDDDPFGMNVPKFNIFSTEKSV
jgi:hypothetical protein